MMDIYLYQNDKQIGPYTEEELRARVGSGTISKTEFAWHEGLSEWKPLNTIIAFAPMVPAYPPPLPTIIQTAKQARSALKEAEDYLRARLSGAEGKPKPVFSDPILLTRQGSFEDLWLWFIDEQLKDKKEPSWIKERILCNMLRWDGRDSRGNIYFHGWLRSKDDPVDHFKDMHYYSTVQELWVWPRGVNKFEWYVTQRRVKLST